MARRLAQIKTSQRWFGRRTLATMVASALTLFVTFFVVFANNLPTPPNDVPRADGIVIFTGTATARITQGVELLADGKGRRLLVSGIYETLDFDDVLRLSPTDTDNIKCCIDLDYAATNTVENAEQTALWADIHGFKSLILVTSAQHVPRAFLELRRTMPTVRLSAWPVVPENVHLDRWWAYSGTTSLLMGEYMRYLWALTGLPRSQ